MFIGQIGFQQNFSTSFFAKKQNSVSNLQKIADQSKIKAVKNVDTFTRSSSYKIEYVETYKGVNRLTPLTPENITYAEHIPEKDLSKNLLSIQNEKNYTEKDALIYQYYKKNCYQSWNVTSDKYVINSDATEQEINNYTNKIIEVGMNQFNRDNLKNTITDEELENFRKELVNTGADDEIDWWEIRSDRISTGLGASEASLLEDRMNYMSARYAVLKDRIETQYTGEEKEKNMQILNDIYQYDKQDLLNSYSKSVSSFFEDFGHAGVSEDIKNSLNAILEQKITEYENYIAQNSNYANISNEEDTWLYKDTAFMTAQLLNNVDASKEITNDSSETQNKYSYSRNEFNFSECLKYNLEGNMNSQTEKYENAVYTMEDLKFAGIYVDTMRECIRDTVSYSGYRDQDDTALGKKFAQQLTDIKKISYSFNIHNNLRQAIENTYQPFLNKVIDKIDEGIEKNRENIIHGERLTYIDRNAVFDAFQSEIQ